MDLYERAELYDLVHPGAAKGELAFWERQARAALPAGEPRVLELACGSGRLSAPLAERGLTVTGLDASAAMLASARERSTRVTWLQADMRAFQLGRQFDFIFVPINSLSHLYTLDDIVACLACARAHLAPTGRFALDLFNPSLTILSRDRDRWFEVGRYTGADGVDVHLSERNAYDSVTQINHILWRFDFADGRRQEAELHMRQFFPQELDAHLRYAGFDFLARYGRYDERPFHADSVQQIVVCKHALSA
jgi:SAM-dependent methyltransferase